MFGSLRRMLGLIKVAEQGDFVLISGLPANFINFSINRIWASSKIASNMFNRISSNQLVFHKFFVPDVIYTLNVVKNDKRSRSNVNVIDKVIEGLYEFTWAKTILEDAPSFLDRSKLSLFHKSPLEHAERFFRTYEENTQKYQLKGYLLGAAPGSGKAHSLDVLLRGPKGNIRMKDVKIGDILYDRCLKTTKVTGVFPQGIKSIYRFTLEDGRSTEVCLEHLWQIHINNTTEVVNTEKVKEYLDKKQLVSIDLPNVLGLSRSKTITVNFHLKCSELGIRNEELRYRALGGVTRRINNANGLQLEVQFRSNNQIAVKNIEYVGEKEAQCISVDNKEQLYIVDDYIVTHNTLMSVMLSRMLDTDTNFFIVPKNALDRVWAATLSTELKKPSHFWISNGEKPLDKGYKDYVVHYEYLEKFLDFVDHAGGDFGKTYVNLDESHNFNDLKSNRTQSLVTLAKDVLETENYLAMSGTPIKAVGTEAVPLLKIIDRLFNPKVEERFLKIYGSSQTRANDILQNRMGTITFKVDKAQTVGNTVHNDTGYVKIPNGKDYTLDAIRQDMKQFIDERLKYYKSERSNYDKEYHRILNIHKAQLDTNEEKANFRQYEKAVQLIRDQYDPVIRKDDIVLANKYERYRIIPHLSPEDKKIFRDVKSVYKYYFLKVQGEALGRILGRKRVQCNVDMVNGLDNIVIKDKKGKVERETSLVDEIMSTEKKTLIFTSFVEVVDRTNDYLKSKGYSPLIVYGDTNKDLANIVHKFETDEKANPLIATFKSLSTAVPLTMANVTVMLNTPFRDYEREQAISRTDRIGQDSDVYCTTVLLDTDNVPNISTRSNDIMQWSKTQIEEIMGFKIDNKQVSLEELSIEDDNKEGEKRVKSLAEQLDMGVDEMLGDEELPRIEEDYGKRRVKQWMAW